MASSSEEKLEKLFACIQGHEKLAFSIARHLGGIIARIRRPAVEQVLGRGFMQPLPDNLAYNRRLEEGLAAQRSMGAAYIEDQAAPPVGAMRVGTASMARSGCGIVAAYNMLASLGRRPQLSEAIAAIEKRGIMLKGELGCDPYMVVRYLEGQGLRCKQIAPACLEAPSSPDDAGGIDANGAEPPAPGDAGSIAGGVAGYIVAFWNDAGDILASAHTIAATLGLDGLLHAHNDNGCHAYASLRDLMAAHPKARPIMVAAIYREE